MSLVVGTNSWANRAEADAYLTDRIDATDWFALNDTPANPGEVSKDSYLISSYYWINTYVTIAATSTDDNVKNAQIEAALFLLGHYDELNERSAAMATGVAEFKYSRRSEVLNINQLSLPPHILGMLKDYAIGNSTIQLKGEYDV